LCRENLGFHLGFELTCVALKMGVFAKIALIIRKAIVRAAVPENLFFTAPRTSNQWLLGFRIETLMARADRTATT
jgi:hypothetical protein